MDIKKINVVWCDDAIDTLNTKTNKELFNSHNCHLFKTAHNSDELKTTLDQFKDYVDAVIVDFNMGEKNLTPGNNEASGFRWVHEHVNDYNPIPFYLFTGRDKEFIDSKYNDFEFSKEDDYFFKPNSNVSTKRNRYFQSNEFEDLLSMIEEEVSVIYTPSFKIRQEFSEAFNAIDMLGLDADVFLNILKADEGIDRYDLCTKANPLRMVIENMISVMESEGVIPSSFAQNLNKVPNLLEGRENQSHLYDSQDYMPKSLATAFKYFLNYTQDGSHDKNYLNLEFKKYLSDTKDIYIVKSLAILGLDIVKWCYTFYEKYKQFQLFTFRPFTTRVSSIVNVDGEDGAIVYDSDNKKYFIPQRTDIHRYYVGTNVTIQERRITQSKFGDYYARAKNEDA